MKKHVLNAVLALVMVFALNSLWAQTTNILQGTVKDAKGEPVIGAAVTIKGTTLGTATDADGKFSLAAPSTAQTLVIKSIGLKTMEVDISKGNFDVVMQEDAMGLDEVVVTAIGIKKEKRALGYAQQDVGSQELVKAANPSALSALSGKVAGLDVITSSGSPGAAVNLRLRGATSLYSGNNQPLIVIDGIPVDNAQNSTTQNINQQQFNINGDVNQNRGIDINPDDIENVSVLKGGAATALYGIDGANGVIAITTKHGTATGNKTFNVDVSTSVVFDQVNKLPELQNQWIQGYGNQLVAFPDDPVNVTPYNYYTRSWGAKYDTLYWTGKNNYYYYDGTRLENDTLSGTDKHGALTGKSDVANAQTPFKPYENEKSFFRTGITTDNSFSISGGSDRGTFRFGITNLYQNGIIPLSNLTKTTVSLGGEMKVGEKVVITGNVSYINSVTTGNTSGNQVSAVTYGIYRTPINFDNRNGITGSYTNKDMYIAPDGRERSYTYVYDRDFGFGASVFANPYWSINKDLYKSYLNRVFGNVSLTADATPWLNFVGRVGVDFYNDRRKQDAALQGPALPEGTVAEDAYTNRIINSDVIATLHHELAKDLNGSLFIGNNVRSTTYQNVFAYGDGLVLPDFYQLSNALTIIATEYTERTLRTAIYGGLNLDWKSQIYFAFTARNDWSSTLPASKRSFFYPSVSLGWVFTETAKLSTNKWFPYGKLRLSWAQVGNDAPAYTLYNNYPTPAIGDGFANNGIKFPFTNGGGNTIAFATNQYLNNQALKPEKTNSYEAGLDLRFMQSGIKVFGGFGIDFTYYYMKTTDEIVPVPVAFSSGYQFAWLNNGSLQNQGFEIMANITPVKVGEFRWDMSVNWSKNISKVLSLAADQNYINIGGFGGAGSGNIYNVIGQPYGVIWGGDFYRDKSGNVIIDDRATLGSDPNPNYGMPLGYKGDTVIGNPNPKWRMGWRNTFSWKGLSLSFLFDIKFGGQMYDGTRGALVTYGRAASTDDREKDHVFKGTPGHLDADGNVVTSGAANSNNVAVPFGQIDPATGASYAEDWYEGNGGGFGPIASQFIEDAGYFRLRELSLGYSFDRKIFKKNRIIKGIDLNFVARNIFLVTKYQGIDPDQALAGASNTQGLEWFNLPNTRSYGLTLKLHF